MSNDSSHNDGVMDVESLRHTVENLREAVDRMNGDLSQKLDSLDSNLVRRLEDVDSKLQNIEGHTRETRDSLAHRTSGDPGEAE